MENLKLTSLEEAIMLAILHHPRYGQDIVEVVSAASQGEYQIGCGTLYPALKRLSRRGFILEQKLQENLDVRNGHSRCYYQVTATGHDTLVRIEIIRDQIKSQSQIHEALT